MEAKVHARPNGSAFGSGAALPRRRGRLRARPQRSALLGMIALLLLVLFFVTLHAAWQDARARAPYLSLARPVPAGAIIRDEDLLRVDAAVDGTVNIVDAADRGRVLGKRAARSLRAGDLLMRSDWIEGAAAGAGRVVVPVTLSGDRLPGRVQVGDRVRLVKTAGGIGRQDGEPVVLTNDGIVVDLTKVSTLSERTVLSVSVPEAEAQVVTAATAEAPDRSVAAGTAVAAASAEGRVAVVLLGRGE
ncbi:MAG: hypothetical protein QOK43_1855 [Acidimicrobiaceae bacterium]|nr:hypothetical protein [Acidimicrobiaceae bacterium]